MLKYKVINCTELDRFNLHRCVYTREDDYYLLKKNSIFLINGAREGGVGVVGVVCVGRALLYMHWLIRRGVAVDLIFVVRDLCPVGSSNEWREITHKRHVPRVPSGRP